MKLFQNNKGKLSEINQVSFKLEKELQSLVESNTNTLFNLTFIGTEIPITNYRIDSLCYDEENKSFVIIEYKKGNSYSVIDQGYTYLQLLLNNKSDFVLILSQYLNKVLKLEDVDWSQSRIIFISPSFNGYQKDSVNFKNLPFELWEVKRYDNNAIIFNQHKSTSKVAIDTIGEQNSSNVISQVSQEVKTYELNDHLSKASSEIQEHWNELSERLLELEETEMIAKKPYISFMYRGTTISYFNFHKNTIRIDIMRGNTNLDGSKSKNFFTLDDPKGISKEAHWTWKSGVQGEYYAINYNHQSDNDYIFFLLKQKHKSLSEKGLD